MDLFVKSTIIFVFFAVSAIFVFHYFNKGSVKAVFFGAPIKSTVGKTSCADKMGFATDLNVYILDSSDPTRAVAIEYQTRVATSIRSTPATFSKNQARELAKLLLEAADRSSN